MQRIVLIVMAALFYLPVFSQISTWSVEDGWAIRDEYDNGKKEKFFAIGLWGIPEYTSTPNNLKNSSVLYGKNKTIFNKYTELFNMIYSHSGHAKDYMGHKIVVSGSSEFPWYFRRYMDNIDKTSHNTAKTKNVNMSLLQKHVRKGLLTGEIDKAINLVKNSHEKNGIGNYIWASIDEVSAWPPILLETIYKRIKLKNDKPLVYIDLAGSGRVRSFKNKQTVAIEADHYDVSFDDEWYQNLRQIAYEYRNGGDVFGVNSYGDFFQKPRLSGISVDAIKAGAGEDVPVWLWFDSATYRKPKNVLLRDYLKNVKCQVYTSIIHGATGIMFWTDRSKEPDVFNAILPLIDEVNKLLPLIKSRTIEKNSNVDFHYMIKDFDNKKIAIISNTNKSDSIRITYPIAKTLAPLEVYVGEM